MIHWNKFEWLEGHHIFGQQGAKIMDFKLICAPLGCHHFIHFVNPNQARKEGWLE